MLRRLRKFFLALREFLVHFHIHFEKITEVSYVLLTDTNWRDSERHSISFVHRPSDVLKVARKDDSWSSLTCQCPFL